MNLSTISLAVSMIASLAACGTSEIGAYNKPKEPRADRAVLLHEVRFVPATTLFEAGE